MQLLLRHVVRCVTMWRMTSETILEEYQQQKKVEQVVARVPEQLKQKAQEKCERLGIPLSFIIERALKEWIESDD